MSNKRNLKKEIRRVCGDLALNCILARDYAAGINKAEMNEMIIKIAMLQRSTLRHVSISFDKSPKDFESRAQYHTAAKVYFAKAYAALRGEFDKNVAEIVKSMNALLTDEQRELNKQAMSK